MAKLTLSFKGHPIDAFRIEKENTLIGRDPGCDVVIDSLAVAPVHAQLVQKGDSYTLIAIDIDHTLAVNQQVITETEIQHGDVIQVGKHNLTFSEDAVQFATILPTDEDETTSLDLEPTLTGYVQILNGSNLGRIIPLQRSLTRLGRSGQGSAVIAHRGNGFFLSHLEGEQPPSVEGQSIANEQSHRLHNGNVIEIGNIRMRFFVEDEKEMKKVEGG